jgi:hypothetical protein
MQILEIEASPKQLSKLRNGHSVRIKKPMSGKGFSLMVNPTTYKIASRAFEKGKASQVRLSPEELGINRTLSRMSSPEVHKKIMSEPSTAEEQQIADMFKDMPFSGRGIFGKRFDKFVEDKLGKEKKDKLYTMAKHLKEPAKMVAKAGLTAGATALGAANPALIPLLAPGVAGASSLIDDYLEDPNKYQSMFGSGLRSSRHGKLKDRTETMVLADKLNKRLGTNYDYLGRAGMENAVADMMRSKMEADSINARFKQLPATVSDSPKAPRSRIPSGMDEVGIVGRGMMRHVPQAMASQPFGANYMFKNMLPPAYQELREGAEMSGSGLYASGRGLYV